MANTPTPPKIIPQNPLAIIALLIALVEAAFAYPVTQLSGTNQTIMVIFMVGFPVFLMLCLLLIMFLKPTALYGPKDYTTDENYLRAIGVISPNAMSEQGVMPQPIQQQPSSPNLGGAQPAR